jgi:hypothetical protein
VAKQMRRFANGLEHRGDIVNFTLDCCGLCIAAASAPAAVEGVDREIAREKWNDEVPCKMIADTAMHH